MNIGISTYAYFWHLSPERAAPWSLTDVIRTTGEFGADIVQICDYAPIDTMDAAQLRAIRSAADEAGLRIELGTRGTDPAHLSRYLDLADALDARIVRTMLTSPSSGPPLSEVRRELANLTQRLERANVRLAIETYEQVPTLVAVELVDAIDSPFVGICSDPANTVAILEHPTDVIDLVAPRVVNMHVKDFGFHRNAGSNGFTLTGVPLGEGLLPYDYMVEAIQPGAQGISQIIEHWLPWQGSEAATLATELKWTRHSLDFLRSRTTQPEGATR